MFFESDVFQKCYDIEPFDLTHNLSSLDLFKPDFLAALADKFASAPKDFYVAESAPTPDTAFYNIVNIIIGTVEFQGGQPVPSTRCDRALMYEDTGAKSTVGLRSTVLRAECTLSPWPKICPGQYSNCTLPLPCADRQVQGSLDPERL
jgi:hypothetical protein